MRFITSILSLIISIALLFAVINPFFKDVKQLKSDVDTYNKALNNSADLQNVRDSLVDKYKNIKQSDKDRLTHLVPSSIDNIELILEIEKIANSHGMPIENIKFDASNLENNNSSGSSINAIAGGVSTNSLSYGIFPMDFSVKGKYSTFTSFLKDLERNLRIIDIKAISFSSANDNKSGGGDSDIYNYTLRIQTYWLK